MGIFDITSGGGPFISVEVFRPRLTVPFLSNRVHCSVSLHLCRELGKRIKNGIRAISLVGPV